MSPLDNAGNADEFKMNVAKCSFQIKKKENEILARF